VNVAGAASAQDARVASQSLHCFGVFHVLKSAQDENSEIARHLDFAASIFADVYRQESRRLIGYKEQTAEQSIRESNENALQKAHSKAAEFREDSVICGAWAEGFLSQGANYRYAPVYPKIIAPQTRHKYETLAEQRLKK